MKRKLHSIKAYLDDEEYRQFKVRVAARGVTESAYIREQLSFEVKQRGAPKGTVQKKKVGRPKTKGKRPASKRKEPLFKFEKVKPDG